MSTGSGTQRAERCSGHCRRITRRAAANWPSLCRGLRCASAGSAKAVTLRTISTQNAALPSITGWLSPARAAGVRSRGHDYLAFHRAVHDNLIVTFGADTLVRTVLAARCAAAGPPGRSFGLRKAVAIVPTAGPDLCKTRTRGSTGRPAPPGARTTFPGLDLSVRPNGTAGQTKRDGPVTKPPRNLLWAALCLTGAAFPGQVRPNAAAILAYQDTAKRNQPTIRRRQQVLTTRAICAGRGGGVGRVGL
jgi:hypothetical protein